MINSVKTYSLQFYPARVLRTVAISGIVLFSSHVGADSNEDFNTWKNTLAPLYLWGVSMSGTITSGPVTGPFELDFSDAFSELEAAYTVHYEGAKGNWGVIIDYSSLNLTPSTAAPGTSAAIDVDMKNIIAEVAGLYRLGADIPWQLLAGYRSYKLDLTASGLPSPPAPASQIVVDETINDVFIGGRYMRDINSKWSVIARADVGTGDSDLVWNALFAFDYRFTKLLSVFAGWRVLDYDVDRGSDADTFKYDMNHSGPLLALAFHW